MFHLFPLLPKELRLHIWTLASFIPQDAITIIYPLASSSSSPTHSSKYESLTPHFRACTPVPAILHTSFESRSTSLQYYTRVFPSPLRSSVASESESESERIIYVNKSVDTVIVCLPTFRHILEGAAGEVLGKMLKTGREGRRKRQRGRQIEQNQRKQMSESELDSSLSLSSAPWGKGEMMRSFAWRDSFPNDTQPANTHSPNPSPKPEPKRQKHIFIVIKPLDRKTCLWTEATQDLRRVGLSTEQVSSTWFEVMGDWDVEGGWDRSWWDLFGEMDVQRERGDGWEDVED